MVGIYANVQMMRIFQKNPEQSLSRKLFTSINITQDDKVLSIYSLSSWPIASYSINMVRWAIWYHMYNLKNVKNIHGGVLILVKLQASASNFTKIDTPPWVSLMSFKLYKWYQIAQAWNFTKINTVCFSRFLNCANGTKSRNASHLLDLIWFQCIYQTSYPTTCPDGYEGGKTRLVEQSLGKVWSRYSKTFQTLNFGKPSYQK